MLAPNCTMTNPSVMVFVDHDIIVRNFLQKDLLDSMAASFSLTFVVPPKSYKDGARISQDLDLIDLPGKLVYLEPVQKRLNLWSHLRTVSRLKPSLDKFSTHIRQITLARLSRIGRIIYPILALPGLFRVYENLIVRIIERHPHLTLEQLILDCRAQLIFHPTVMNGVYVHDLVGISKKLSIPLLLAMNSWDNVAGRRYLATNPDWLIVWGKQTFNHAKTLMSMPEDKIKRFGAPQLDIYKTQPGITRETFCSRHSLSSDNLIVLYAGSSKGVDEYSHLEFLEQLIQKKYSDCVRVIYRPHPWGGAGKNGHRILNNQWDFVELERSSLGYLENIQMGLSHRSYPKLEDARDTLYSVDAVISPLSTILIEAALCGKPSMCFVPSDEDSKHLAIAAPLRHFQEIYDSPDFLVAHTTRELEELFDELLKRAKDPTTRPRMIKATEYFIESTPQPYSKSLINLINEIHNTNDDPR